MTCCQVLDVRHGQRVEVKETEQMTPTAFIFLYENQLFLTFKHRTVAVWNFRVRRTTAQASCRSGGACMRPCPNSIEAEAGLQCARSMQPRQECVTADCTSDLTCEACPDALTPVSGGAGDEFRGPRPVVPRRADQQHLHHAQPEPHPVLLQGTPPAGAHPACIQSSCLHKVHRCTRRGKGFQVPSSLVMRTNLSGHARELGLGLPCRLLSC